ncbi:helix-turn-helix transcriptional regulator [Rapidithrix thailandica]|uniref:Helix-turn-helix transcriptional regulator n=1 Tax=Rapidithrix thailandica TaxID=413964 RepID=A0AAW9SEL7_9BACT
MDYFSTNIKYLRKTKRFSTKEMGDELGISSGAVSAYENDKNIPSLTVVLKYCEYFNVEIEDIVHKDIYRDKPSVKQHINNINQLSKNLENDKDEVIKNQNMLINILQERLKTFEDKVKTLEEQLKTK